MAIKKSTKAKKAAQTRKKNAENKAGKRQITAIFLFALGILTFALTIYPGESFWLVLHNFLLGLFSYAAFAIAPLLIYVAVMLTKNKPVHAFGGKVTLACLLVLEACGLLYLFIHTPMTTEGFAFVGELFTLSANLQQGGVFSLLFGYWMELLWGYTGAIIFDFILLLVSVLLFTGLTLADALRLAKKPVDKLGEVYHTQVEAYKERKNRFNVDVDIDGVAENQPKTKTAAAAKEDIKPELDAVMRAFGAAPAEEAKPAPVEEKSEEPVQSKTADLAALAEERAAMIAAEEEADAKTKFDPPAENEEKGAPKTAYRFPPLSLLRQKETTNTTDIRRELEENGNHLVQVLESFGVSTKVTHISRGPSVTRYELQPSAGVKISRITNLADDIALNLAASGVRIEAPIPGKAAVGIEVPNKTRSAVNLSEIVGSREFKSAKSKLTVALGRDIAGNVAITDIASMPHILIAGATGSGKSVCINTFIMSLLYKATPDEVRLLLIDPKVVELGVYNGIPHLLVPVVTDPKKASGALAWAVGEMMQRYKLFAETDTRNLKAYNELAEKDETRKPLPQIVIIIDELADLMMAAPGEVEDAICRLAQMARAAGMHLMIATQRPSVDVITGLIKANIPSRLSFAVTSQIDSRTILDGGGAEKLLGRGDMLFKPMGENKSQRIQGCFVSDAEIESVISFLTADSQAEYDEEVAKEIERLKATEKGKRGSGGGDDLPDEEEVDEIFFKAIEVVVEAGQASTSLLQRRLKLGYARAARYIDMMDQRGIVGPFEGSKPRKVLITKEQLMEMTLNNTLPVPEELP